MTTGDIAVPWSDCSGRLLLLTHLSGCRQDDQGDGESLSRPLGKTKVYPGGGKSGKLKDSLSKTQKSEGKKHTAGKHGSFKSKTKHKRRYC